MGSVGVGGTLAFQGQTDGFHDIFLGVWNNPFHFVFQIPVCLFKIITVVKDDLLLRRVVEEFPQVGAEALENVNESCDGGRGDEKRPAGIKNGGTDPGFWRGEAAGRRCSQILRRQAFFGIWRDWGAYGLEYGYPMVLGMGIGFVYHIIYRVEEDSNGVFHREKI